VGHRSPGLCASGDEPVEERGETGPCRPSLP
jgi:hypothetical protein